MRLEAGEKGISRRLQVSRLRGRGGAGVEGGIIGVGGNDRRLVFMMSIVLGMPGCHTIYGNSSVVGGAMDVIAPPSTCDNSPEVEKGLDTGKTVEKGLETRESRSQGKATVSPCHTIPALPPTPSTRVGLSQAGAQQKIHLVLVPAASLLLCRGAELTRNNSGYECMGARIIIAPHSRPCISSASQPDIADGKITRVHRHEIVCYIFCSCRNSSAPQAPRSFVRLPLA